MNNNIYEYLNGNQELKNILQIFRNCLCSSYSIEYGAIAIYSHIQETETKVNVFPINPEIINKFPDDEIIRENILEAINSDRKYSEFYYYEQFKEHHDSINHLKFILTEKTDILSFTKDRIEGKNWDKYLRSLNGRHNILDQLFYQSNESKFLVLPIPLLFCPIAFFVLPDSVLDTDQIEKITQSVGESVQLYIFDKLLTEVTCDLKPEFVKDKNELIHRFINELIQVITPIKYLFNGAETQCFDWYGDWKTDGSAQVTLNLAGEDVVLFMPSFCWFNEKMIDNIDEFKTKTNQSIITIQNIFNLVFRYWETLNSKKLLIKEEISPLIKDLKDNIRLNKILKEELEEKTTEQSQKIEQLSKLIIDLGGDTNMPTPFEFYSILKSDGKKVWKIRFNSTNVVLAGTDKGYEGLHAIMSNPNIEIPVSRLGANKNNSGNKKDIDVEQSKNEWHIKILEIEKKMINGDSGGVDGLEEYAFNLANYIYFCKETGCSYSEQNKKLTLTMGTILKLHSPKKYKKFEQKITEIAKQSKKNNFNKLEQDYILQPIRVLIKKLMKEQNGILEPVLRCIHVGVISKYEPKGELRNLLWRFNSEYPDLE